MRTSRLAVIALLAAAALSAAPTGARAQSESEFAAYLALIFTPVGALPARVHGTDDRTAPAAVDFRYGRLAYESDDVTNSFALGYSTPVPTGRFGVTVGASTHEGTDAILFLGGDYETTVARIEREEGAFGIGLLPAGGIALPTGGEGEGTALSLSLGVPLTYTAGRTWRVTAHATPGFNWGRIADDGLSEGGTRMTLGFGLAARSPRGVGLMAGFQKVLVEGSEPVLGVGVSFGGPRR